MWLRRALHAAAILALCVSVSRAERGTPPPNFYRIFATGALSGNGADTTTDALSTCSYTVPANTISNVGDTLHVRAAGGFAASTDTKIVRIQINGTGGPLIGTTTGNLAATTTWAIDAYVLETAHGAQSYGSIGTLLNGGSTPRSGTLTFTETNPVQVLVSGQNLSNSVAGSVTCQIMTLNFER